MALRAGIAFLSILFLRFAYLYGLPVLSVLNGGIWLSPYGQAGGSGVDGWAFFSCLRE